MLFLVWQLFQLLLFGIIDMKNHYTNKWLFQRLSALLLIPLSLWFIYQCISFQDLSYEEIKSFFESFLNSILFLLMMTMMLLHSKIGCETIIQDYISIKHLRIILNRIINFITLILLFLLILALIKLYFSSWRKLIILLITIMMQL